MEFKIGQKVRQVGNYIKMPEIVRNLLTFIVVEVYEDSVGVAFCNTNGIWRPQIYKKEQLIIVC